MTEQQSDVSQSNPYDLPLGPPEEKKEAPKEQPKEQTENRESTEPRERREHNRQREPRERREQRPPRQQREPREQQEPRQPREQREPQEQRDSKENRDKRDPREQREQRDPKEAKDQNGGRRERNQDPRRQSRWNDKPQGAQGDRDRSNDRQSDRSSQNIPSGSPEISVVIPLYNEEQSLRELYDQLKDVLYKTGRYEIIFIDDGSTDGSARVLQELRKRDPRVKIIRFRRNYGKSAALSAGFHHAHGNYVVTMDADLQDDPSAIPALINELKKGFDLVSGWKKKRYDPITKTIPSKFFNFVTSMMTDIKLHDFNCGLKAYRKEVIKEVKVYGELHRYIPVLAHWAGFKIGEISVPHRPRKYGTTKFGVGRFWKGFLDLITVLFTTRYMSRPLHLFGFWGSLMSGLGFLISLYLVYTKFVEGIPLGNRPLFLGGVLLIIVGVQFISLGLVGEMITKTSRESQSEYAVKEIWK